MTKNFKIWRKQFPPVLSLGLNPSREHNQREGPVSMWRIAFKVEEKEHPAEEEGEEEELEEEEEKL